MAIRYKLTTQAQTTHKGFKWVPGEWREAKGKGAEGCTDGVLHYYDSPKAAAMFNLCHADLKSPILWSFETDQEIGHDGLKGWCKRVRILEKMALPVFSTEQRVAFAIRCALLAYKNKAFTTWAENWLSGKDRSARTAYATRAAVYAAAEVATRAAAYATRAAVYAAAEVATRAAADAAAEVAARAANAADAAANAASAAANAAANAGVTREQINALLEAV
jgi:hypothetical protein